MYEKKAGRTRNNLRNTILLNLVVLLVSLVIWGGNSICAGEQSQPDPNTLLLLHFDEETGNPQDSSGNNNTVTNIGAEYMTSGKFNNALSFNGVDNEVVIKHNSIFNNSEELTVEAWVYFNSAPTSPQGVVVKDGFGGGVTAAGFDACSRDWSLAFDEGTNRLYCRIFNSAGATAAAYIDLTARKWNHVAMTWDGATIKVYLNGVYLRSQSFSSARKKGEANITIGRHNVAVNGYFSGISMRFVYQM